MPMTLALAWALGCGEGGITGAARACRGMTPALAMVRAPPRARRGERIVDLRKESIAICSTACALLMRRVPPQARGALSHHELRLRLSHCCGVFGREYDA